MGYGVLEDGENPTFIDCGTLAASSRLPVSQRLYHLHSQLKELIAHYQPTEAAIEQPFLSQNVRSALAMGRAEAIAMLAAAEGDIPTFSYSPAQVKQSVTGYGNAEKEQVREMVKLQLNLPSASWSEDAADALAVAICHINQTKLAELLAGEGAE
jgi:crossover junction endodeoxyribonuclease RuvC